MTANQKELQEGASLHVARAGLNEAGEPWNKRGAATTVPHAASLVASKVLTKPATEQTTKGKGTKQTQVQKSTRLTGRTRSGDWRRNWNGSRRLHVHGKTNKMSIQCCEIAAHTAPTNRTVHVNRPQAAPQRQSPLLSAEPTVSAYWLKTQKLSSVGSTEILQ
jgi:hypothetical protein